MKFWSYILFLFSIILHSCGTSSPEYKKLPKEDMYFLFKYTKEIIDSSNNVTIKYELSDFSKNEREKDTLVSILKKFGWIYKVTTDNQVFISISALNDMDNLYFLNNELEKTIRGK